MIVCIAEKPSVAKEIAKVLGANTSHDGYMEGNGYQVTWTFGHLCTLKEPQDYCDQWRRWSLGALPMIPPRFGIKLIDNQGYEKQFGTIERLFQAADGIINCGDAGQEGELIQRWVMQKAKAKCPVQRLWVSSLTEEAIREAFSNLKSQEEYQSLYEAGLCRAIGDWLLGMNATRLYTLRFAQAKGQVLSIGRVQTPTLAMIVKRHFEIKNFKPEKYWILSTVYRGVTFSSTKGKIKKIEEGQKAMEEIKGKDFTVTSIEQKAGTEAPPRLFDLTSLQVECNKKYSFSADDTLKHIQSLYEKKLTTYPRVDTTFLSDDIYAKCPGILQGIRPYAPLIQPLMGKKLKKSKKVFDSSKVTDHHAIIPTGTDPSSVSISLDEKRVYDMVARRFIAVFYPDCNSPPPRCWGQWRRWSSRPLASRFSTKAGAWSSVENQTHPKRRTSRIRGTTMSRPFPPSSRANMAHMSLPSARSRPPLPNPTPRPPSSAPWRRPARWWTTKNCATPSRPTASDVPPRVPPSSRHSTSGSIFRKFARVWNPRPQALPS